MVSSSCVHFWSPCTGYKANLGLHQNCCLTSGLRASRNMCQLLAWHEEFPNSKFECCAGYKANLAAAGESDGRLEARLAQNSSTFSALSLDNAVAAMPRLQVQLSYSVILSKFKYYTLFLPEERCVCRQAAVKAAKFLPLDGLARSKQDPINRGHGAQYLYRPPPAGACNIEEAKSSCRFSALSCSPRSQEMSGNPRISLLVGLRNP